MKTIYFVRHAKSSWDHAGMRDIDRPLNERGLRDAPFMAQLLAGKIARPDRILSSPANRAHSTAQFFASAFGIPAGEVEVVREIYEAWPDEIIRIVTNLPDEWGTVFLFGHNPTFTAVANMFSEEYILNLPTCGIFSVEADVDTWKKFGREKGRLTALHFPKQHLD
ncbi:MAG: histidine phosphatase family protein [Saprospiraceae bacterium]|nr:histidine phosphatase family protein [Saprospiraceae bacterium]